jgi:hypothetical protein
MSASVNVVLISEYLLINTTLEWECSQLICLTMRFKLNKLFIKQHIIILLTSMRPKDKNIGHSKSFLDIEYVLYFKYYILNSLEVSTSCFSSAVQYVNTIAPTRNIIFYTTQNAKVSAKPKWSVTKAKNINLSQTCCICCF